MNTKLKKLFKKIKNKKSICLLAPSFVVDFKYPDIILKLRELGFDKVVELTYAAKLVSSEYHELIKADNTKQRICANCPSIVKLIENKYPEIKNKLTNITSPMVLMGRFCKKEFGSQFLTVFIGPCIAKKIEAKENKKDIDIALTFRELKEGYNFAKENKELVKIIKNSKNKDFNKFYNDYTKIYPLSGALGKTIHLKNILKKDQIISAEGIEKIDKAIKRMEKEKNIKFLDVLFCKGGCTGGSGIATLDNYKTRVQKVRDYRKHSRKHKIGKKKGLLKYAKELNIDIRRNKDEILQ